MRDELVKEYEDALNQYKVALNQENECSPEFIDLAIEKVAVTKQRLDLALRKLKKYDKSVQQTKNINQKTDNEVSYCLHTV